MQYSRTRDRIKGEQKASLNSKLNTKTKGARNKKAKRDTRQSSNAKQADKVATKKGKTKYNRKKQLQIKTNAKSKSQGPGRQAETGRNMNT